MKAVAPLLLVGLSAAEAGLHAELSPSPEPAA